MSTLTNDLGAIQATPARRLVAAGIKRTGQPWQVEQPQQSPADQAAHAAASHVRRPLRPVVA